MRPIFTTRKTPFILGVVVVLAVSLALVGYSEMVANSPPSPNGGVVQKGQPTFSFLVRDGSNNKSLQSLDGIYRPTLTGSAGTVAAMQLELSLPTALPIRLDMFDSANNGTLTLPSGAQVYATVQGQTFQVEQPNGTGSFSTNNKLFFAGPGYVNVEISVHIPTGSEASSNYYFLLGIATFSNSSAVQETYGNAVNMTLDVA